MNRRFEEFNKQVNHSIDVAKQYAIKAYTAHCSKKDVISYAVGLHVMSNLKQISPRPTLLKRCLRGDCISFNMILDSIDEKGILIGATAYRLAEQLETELVDNGIKPKSHSTAAYVDGQLCPEISTLEIPISVMYLKYFEQHPFSIMQHNEYWFQRIRDTTSEDDHMKLDMLKSYLVLYSFCRIHRVLLFIYNKLKSLCVKADAKADIKDLEILKEDVATQLDRCNYDFNNNEHQAALSAFACIAIVIDEFKVLAEKQE